MLPLIGIALLALLLVGGGASSKPKEAAPPGPPGGGGTPGGGPPAGPPGAIPAIPAAAAAELAKIHAANAAFADALANTIASGNPYFLVQYIPGLGNAPALGKYVSDIIIKNLSGKDQSWTGKSGAIYKSFDFQPKSPITFTGPKGQTFTATGEWMLTHLILNPAPGVLTPVMVYAERNFDKATRKLVAVAPGATDAQINTARSDFAVNDAGVFAPPAAPSA